MYQILFLNGYLSGIFMKSSIKVLLVIFFVQLISGCAAKKLYISEKASIAVSKENIQDEKLSISAVRELYKQGKYSLAEQVLAEASLLTPEDV